MLSQARGEGDGGYMSKSAVRTVFSEISFHTTGHQRYETTGRPPSVRVAEETQMNIYRPKYGFEPSPIMALV